MAVFFMTYDLGHADGAAHYKPFFDELTRLKARRVLERGCMINLNTADPKRVVENLMKLLEEQDRLLTVRMEPANYFYLNTLPGTNDFLKEFPPTRFEPSASAPETPERPN